MIFDMGTFIGAWVGLIFPLPTPGTGLLLGAGLGFAEFPTVLIMSSTGFPVVFSAMMDLLSGFRPEL